MPTENIKNSDLTFAVTKSNITMNPNPAYGTATAVKMENNPAYAGTIH